jgi:tetratricopeptide (TPR) repeat protein
LSSAEFHTELARGHALLQAGEAAQGVAAFQRAAVLEPGAVEARVGLALAHRRVRRLPEAEQAARAALALEPGHVVALYELGLALHGQGIIAQAAAALEKACAGQPGSAEAQYARGVALFGLAKVEDAAIAFQKALDANPRYPAAHTNLAIALKLLGRFHEAEAAFAAAVELSPQSAEAHYNLGVIRQDLGRMAAAAACFRQAIVLKPDHAEAHFSLSLQTPPDDRSPPAETDFARLRRQVEGDEGRSPKARSTLLFAMAKLLEDRGDPDRAFACLEEANRLGREPPGARGFPAAERLGEIAHAFDRPLMTRLTGAGGPSRRPIFIVGMPRSGTTLVEQIISAHPQVEGAGELPNFGHIVHQARGVDGAVFPFWAQDLTAEVSTAIGRAYLDSLPAAAGAARVTDKATVNFAFLGLIHLCLPGATIIHCRRDPRDVGVSCFAARFNEGLDFTHDLAELGRYWRAYDALMDHWRAVLPPGRIFDAPYEALVQDVETWARRLVAHCGLEWDDACLRFYDSDRPVLTGSVAQVRRPIYGGSVGRWRRFEAHLSPLLDALGEPWARGEGFMTGCD